MVTINIASLQEGAHDVVLEPEAEALDLDPARFEKIVVNARLNIFDGRIVTKLTVSTTATLECDRTLKPFKKPLTGKFLLLFAPPEALEADGEFGDIRPLGQWDREIDITDAVRDTLLLSVPARCVAPGAEELDIPTKFGHDDKEIDPRWAALAKLRAGQAGDKT